MLEVKSLTKAFDIVEFISNVTYCPTLREIVSNLNINRSTAYRLINSLISRGYLMKNEETNGYQLGLIFLPLAARTLNSHRLRVECLPYLHDLANKIGERVNLGIIYDGSVMYLGGIEKPSLPAIYSRFGKTAPAHCCSLGKVMLAYMPEEEVDRILAEKPLVKMTENTITNPEQFKNHLAEIRSKGYAIDNQEHINGSYCISTLIKGSKGRGIGSISISSEDPKKIRKHLKDLQQTAEMLSHVMGYGAD